MESNANPKVAYEEMGRNSSSKKHGPFGRPMFVSTNVGTHLVISTNPSDTVADLRGALLSTAVGKAEDNGRNGSIHSRFVNILSKKTSLGELFKIASSRRKSEHFGGRFVIDESPSVDMVLETQDSQLDPILDSHNNTVLSNQTYKDGKFSIEASKTILASKPHPNDTQKTLQKFDFPCSPDKPNMNTVQLKNTLEKHNIDESGQMKV